MNGILVALNAHPDNQEATMTSERVQLDQAAVAARLGVAVASVQRYRVADRERYGFPEPDGVLGRTPWWWAETIDAWAATRPGKGTGAGRPSKAELERRAAEAAEAEKLAAARKAARRKAAAK